MAPTNAAGSFYHLGGGLPPDGFCQGLACFVARQAAAKGARPEPGRRSRDQSSDGESLADSEDGAPVPRLYCLGKCFAAPAAVADDPAPTIQVAAREAVVLDNAAAGAAPEIDEYVRRGGYDALRQARAMSPEALVGVVEGSGLRGRGGAGFPTGRKWRSVAAAGSGPRFVVANADEGDPGAYVDRFILERDPHRLLEGLAIAAHAVGARRGYIYLRAEYPQAAMVLRRALDEARAAGFLADRSTESTSAGATPGADGDPTGGAEAGLDIELVVGEGSYICGEETALLNAVEGRRPEARPRPPFPTTQGLWNRPTLVNNVETLAAIPWIVRHGAEAYADLGFSTSRGTKVVSLSSLFNRPGLYEVEFGVSVRYLVEDLGGGLRTGAPKGVIIGGPLAGIIPPSLFDTPFGFDELHAIGAAVGHGGVVGFDEHTSIAALAHHVFSFGAYESCGRCTPCRLGSRRLERQLAAWMGNAGRPPSLGPDGTRDLGRSFQTPAAARQSWRDIVGALGATSLCGLGSGLAEFAASIERHYPEELERWFA